MVLSAEGGSRTRTGLRPLDPESSASANSATSAVYHIILFVLKGVKHRKRGSIDFFFKTNWGNKEHFIEIASKAQVLLTFLKYPKENRVVSH